MSNKTQEASPVFTVPEETLGAIAIVGLACRFPGAQNIEEFWHNLRSGVESITPLSLQDMLDAGVDATTARHPQRVPVAPMLSGSDYFDAGFFDFSPRQAELTDPQHRLFLECCWEALESAGYDPATYAQAIGIFAGSSISSYLLFNLYPSLGHTNASSDLPLLIGNDKDYLATQAAYRLNLKGPAINVQTACSTSLVAVHLACQSLLNRECDMALAGGVTVRVPAGAGYLYQEGGILSPDGHCRPFDAGAQGTVFGSGMGIVVLKRLEDALADGDVIDAVIKGSAVNNDGSLKAGFTAPSEDGQAAVIAEALAMAGVEAESIRYVETHGTGTPLGDPIEIAALNKAFRAHQGSRPLQTGSCAIGAVKSNVGHLEAAAGIAGLIKTVLALKHRQIPPTLHFTQPNPRIDFTRTPFYVNTRLSTWEREQTPRRACVSSFGIGGTNAHVVLEEAPEYTSTSTGAEESFADRPYTLPISAHDLDALMALVRAYQGFLSNESSDTPLPLHTLCWSASMRRRHHRYRVALVGRTRDDLMAQLAALDQDQANAAPPKAASSRQKVVFVFPGQGSQWIGMGRQLLEGEPVFRAELEQCDQVIRRFTGWSLITMLTRRDEGEALFAQTDRIQMALFAVQVGLVALWRSWGVEPDAVVGHSMGEVAAAYVAGVLSLEDAVSILHHRNRLLRTVLGKGKMLATGLTLEQASEALVGHETLVSIAISNSPKSTVLSGDPGALKEVAASLKSRGTFHRWINVDFASHSMHMDVLLPDLRKALGNVSPRKATIPIISTVTGTASNGTEMDTEYWVRNLRAPVLFADATRWLRQNEYAVFVEVSPHPILLPSIEDSLYQLNLPGTVVPTLRRDADEQRSMLEALGSLYRAGLPIEWHHLYPQGGQYARLPAYQWHRQRYWVEAPQRALTTSGVENEPAAHPLLGRQLRSALRDIQFESHVSIHTLPYLADHRVCGRVVFPAAAYLEMLWQALSTWDADSLAMTDVVFHSPLTFTEEEQHLLQTILTPTSEHEGTLHVFRWEKDASVWRVHATANVRTAHNDGDTPPPTLASIQMRCEQELSPAAYYTRLREQGLEYGPTFQGIEALWLGKGEVVGRVHLPDVLTAEAGTYGMHPALLDACLQLLGATFVDNGISSSGPLLDKKDGPQDIYLPLGVESFRIHLPAQERVWGHVRVRPTVQHETRTGDMCLYDEQGQLVVEIRGLCVKRVSWTDVQSLLQDNLDDWFYELQWQHQPLDALGRSSQRVQQGVGHWLILADHQGVGESLAALFAERGERTTMVFPGTGYQRDAIQSSYTIDPAHLEDFQRLLAEDDVHYRGVMYLWGLDATPVEVTTEASLSSDEARICGGVLHLVQALVQGRWAPSSRLWMVTCGAQPVEASAVPLSVAQSPLWGLGRSIALEHPDLHCTPADLDPLNLEDSVRTLFADVCAIGAQEQVAYRHGERFVARLIRSTFPISTSGVPTNARQSLQLVSTARGILDNLAFETVQHRVPGEGEVEIRVRATGLNFRDVLNALGTYPGDPGPLGLECAGEIVAVGKGVNEFTAGDDVVALAHGCFRTFVTVPAMFVAHKPKCLSYTEAATIPISFMTAYYGLSHLANMSAGDRILIHAAAGGLGLAATQLAQRAGAEVFATAGNDEKRAYLRSLGVTHIMNSRTLGFTGSVMELSGGQGVDIVLNSLTGEYIPRNLSILSTKGRFVEVGKIGIWDADRMQQVRPDVLYSAFDLGQEAQKNPELIGTMLRYLMHEFEQGRLSPLPHRVFPLREAIGAFRYMAQAKHIGKIVVTQEVGLSGRVPNRFREDCSYLITGGLGGLGLQVAQWMVERGARHLALIGRSPASVAAQEVVVELERSGVQVLVIQADVSRAKQVAHTLETIRETMPSLRGIVHAAGSIDDGILLRQDWERFARVFAPKVQGTWNLHTQTRGQTLDFFVLFSSIAAVWGSAGQGSYAAANAFQDALVHIRQSQGLPAQSINWGGWAEVGLAGRKEVTNRMTVRGLRPIAPKLGVQALEQAMYQQKPQIAILPVDWSTFLQQFPGGQVPAMLTALTSLVNKRNKHLAERPSAPGQSELRRRLEETAPYNRKRVLLTALCDQAKSSLGLLPDFQLDTHQPLNELGLDSLMAIELGNKLSISVAQTLPATILFDYPTVAGLTNYLASEVLHFPLEKMEEGGGRGSTATHATDGEDTLLVDLQQLPEEEVEKLLAEELAAVQSLLQRGTS